MLKIFCIFISQKERVVINGEPIIYSLHQRTTILDTAAFSCFSGIMFYADDIGSLSVTILYLPRLLLLLLLLLVFIFFVGF